MRGNYSGTEVFFFTAVINCLRQILGGKMPRHTFYFLLTQGFTHNKLILGKKKKRKKRSFSELKVLTSNICFLGVTWGSGGFRKHNYFHPIINMRFSWNINYLSKYNRPH